MTDHGVPARRGTRPPDAATRDAGTRRRPASAPGHRARNPLVDMQTMAPASRLDDPGVGLRENGRRVLRYADLRSLFDDPDRREPGRTWSCI